jgi:hypothetical protein
MWPRGQIDSDMVNPIEGQSGASHGGPDSTLSSAGTEGTVSSARRVTGTLALVLELAVATIEGCDFITFLVIDGTEMSAPVHTDPLGGVMDTEQRQTGQGPCLEAAVYQRMIYAADLLTNSTWPTFAPVAVAAGLRSILALPLLGSGHPASLNLYSRLPSAFGAVDRARGVLLASLAAGSLSAAQLHEDDEAMVANLHSALSTRELIGQAEGILMERDRITADQAFDVLRRASQHLNVKLREVAQTLIDTGNEPETGVS